MPIPRPIIAPQPPTSGVPQLAKKPNYDFEKRKKEIARKAKKDEKNRRKRENAEQPDDFMMGQVDEFGNPVPAQEPAAPPE